MTFVSYAQNFEDVMLHRALKHVQHGVYVDVGAQHPTVDSVTKAFSLNGWRGINIEPVKHWFDMLKEDRPHDINLNVAVGEGGALSFFEVQGTGLSTNDAELAARYVAEGREVIERTVRAVPLDEILSAHPFDEVHFLKVDCEGAERAALASCSFATVRPWIIVVEATEPNSQVSTAWQWEDLLTERGYVRAYNDGLNLYFVAKEHEELVAAFNLPPNVFDDYERARDKEAHEQRVEFHLLAHNLNIEVNALRSSVADLSRSLGVVTEEHTRWRARANEDLLAAVARRDALLAAVAQRDALLAADARRDALHNSMINEHSRVIQQHRELTGRVAQLELEVSRRDDIVHAMVRSTSWRITAPVRLVKGQSVRVARAVWRLSRPIVARAARASKPLLHAALRTPGFRAAVRLVAGPQTAIGRRGRAFLFPVALAGAGNEPPVAMTESAEAMEVQLRAAIERKLRG
ncbi:FkbM family methyltransferase [Luteibacter rhizovicinus]|uniref:FkbM family methyltransferase n=1 Tax=Luteibacter rhizovicinus TaxID=242606 RepID=A0A4V2W4G1_9GAMM|nr:FkbM family methyltransferase [Luteibacter rhizovicinus]TCV95769.1 FkbM family methyltransferase [Luteibacter rhizovicinus]